MRAWCHAARALARPVDHDAAIAMMIAKITTAPASAVTTHTPRRNSRSARAGSSTGSRAGSRAGPPGPGATGAVAGRCGPGTTGSPLLGVATELPRAIAHGPDPAL